MFTHRCICVFVCVCAVCAWSVSLHMTATGAASFPATGGTRLRCAGDQHCQETEGNRRKPKKQTGKEKQRETEKVKNAKLFGFSKCISRDTWQRHCDIMCKSHKSLCFQRAEIDSIFRGFMFLCSKDPAALHQGALFRYSLCKFSLLLLFSDFSVTFLWPFLPSRFVYAFACRQGHWDAEHRQSASS